MKKLLVVVDMQNDFVDGALANPAAQAIVKPICDKIAAWDGDIIATLDTHQENYMETREGKYLPVPHCIKSTNGHKLNGDIQNALMEFDAAGGHVVICEKPTFGSVALASLIKDDAYDYIEFVGTCTSICVVSNALVLKANFPETNMAVDASCCACLNEDTHNAALTVMQTCQIDILNR